MDDVSIAQARSISCWGRGYGEPVMDDWKELLFIMSTWIEPPSEIRTPAIDRSSLVVDMRNVRFRYDAKEDGSGTRAI